MEKKIVMYPGTFDPLTLGHLDVIQESSRIFGEVIVGLLINTSKKPRFTEYERKTMIEEAVADLGLTNVSVKIFKGLAVELARQEKAVAIIRGLRLTTEYEDELNIVFNNRILEPGITPVLIPPRQEHIHISSSIVRELLDFGNSDLDKYVPQAVLEHIGALEERYKARVLEVLNRLSGGKGLVRFVWDTLVKCYEEPHRVYHTLKHINDCLNEFEKIKPTLQNLDAVEMAILFHDSVYDIHAKDNEEESAEFAKEMIKLFGLPPSFGEHVAKLIIATKHDVPPKDFDAQILVDIDLASLGYSERECDKNAAKIRKEHPQVNEEVFKAKRLEILQSFLGRKIIYGTQFFYEKYETKARQNIARAIAKLSK